MYDTGAESKQPGLFMMELGIALESRYIINKGIKSINTPGKCTCALLGNDDFQTTDVHVI